MTDTAKHVLLFGATGTAGQGTLSALLNDGHDVTAYLRPGREGLMPEGVRVVTGTLAPIDLARAFGHGPDAVISCLASRTGAPADAWAIDHAAHIAILGEAERAGVAQFTYLSAICVQKPRLAFQQAKLAFERALRESPIPHTIIRPTAFFKSLSGQVRRVKAGKPFVMFGDGQQTACKPISDRDLGRFIARSLQDPDMAHRVLPIGGRGPAITPADQAAMLSELLGTPCRTKRVPPGLMGAIVAGLSLAGMVSARARAKADLARIGRYYATESMLLWDPETGAYDAEATPEFGNDTLRDHYAALLRGDRQADLGAHAVFSD